MYQFQVGYEVRVVCRVALGGVSLDPRSENLRIQIQITTFPQTQQILPGDTCLSFFFLRGWGVGSTGARRKQSHATGEVG